MKRLTSRAGTPPRRWIAPLVLLAFFLAGCGALGGDEEEPTATAEASQAEPTSTVPPFASPPAGVGEQTPPPNIDLPSPAAIVASPSVTSAEATPVATPGPLATPEAPTSSEIPEASAPTGDGTTGAVSAGTPEPPEAAPPPSGTPTAAEAPLVVTSCSPEEVPPFGGDNPAYVVLEDLNFRSGPGTDCELIGEGPLGAGTELTVTGGPVVREGEEDLEWLQVQVGEATGWVAADFVGPAEQE